MVLLLSILITIIALLKTVFWISSYKSIHKCKCEAKEIPVIFPQRQLLHKSLKLTDARFKWIRKQTEWTKTTFRPVGIQYLLSYLMFLRWFLGCEALVRLRVSYAAERLFSLVRKQISDCYLILYIYFQNETVCFVVTSGTVEFIQS